MLHEFPGGFCPLHAHVFFVSFRLSEQFSQFKPLMKTMQSIRSYLALAIIGFFCVSLSFLTEMLCAQVPQAATPPATGYSTYASPYAVPANQMPQHQLQQNQLQAAPSQVQPSQVPPVQQDPIRMQTLQTPPKTITHNGIPVYQQQPGRPNYSGSSATQPHAPERTMPAGFGSPYPTGTTMVASNPNAPNTGNTSNVYGVSPAVQPQPATGPVAANHGGVPSYGYVYDPKPQGPMAVNYGAAQTASATANPASTDHANVAGPAAHPQLAHMGRSAPASRVQPFVLTQEEQRELDEFLVRWERYSQTIKRYDVDFTSYYYDAAVIRANPADVGKPVQTTFGFFKYVAPSRFVYNTEGEWVGGKQVKREKQREDEHPKAFAEKILIDEKTVFYYDYNAKTVKQINIPAEMIGKGIADSPLPLIFGAKAEDMKKRFFMKIVTSEQHKATQIWLQTRPRHIEDQSEFSQLEIRIDKKTLRAMALKKDLDVKGNAYKVYVLNEPKINDNLDRIRETLTGFFRSDIPKDWKHVVEDYTVMQAEATPRPQDRPGHPVQPAPAQPHGNVAREPQRNEIPLYSPK